LVAEIDMVDASFLLSAQAVRDRASRMLALGLEDRLPHFRIDIGRLDVAVDAVLATMRKNYPTGEVPFHSRWRHFAISGEDRWTSLADQVNWPDRATRARAEFDLAIISVLLDAGAGPAWRYYDDRHHMRIGRSEGLALASLDMFASGLFSARRDNPLRVDAEALLRLSMADLEQGFQIRSDNLLVGLKGRVELLRRLGALLQAKPEIFAINDTSRPGGLFDHLLLRAKGNRIAAPNILDELLRELAPIWPSRIALAGIPLGDCWRHPALVTDDETSTLVPLHKLSQWMAYSLIEPLEHSGLKVEQIDGLTGLAEYRNGGLFIDCGVLSLRDSREAMREHDVASPLVVEWRSLTVALLDRVAATLRGRLGLNAESLPLGKILEGGSWAAGRAIAFERRPDGSPPLKVISDGTVF
jgi:hypothetical protein